jgi:hypothetical protein
VSRSSTRCRLSSAVTLETLEIRRLMASPQVLEPQPRDQRADYIEDYYGIEFALPASYYQWEYTGPRLHFGFESSTMVTTSTKA